FFAKVRSVGIGLLMAAVLGTGIGATVYRAHAEDAPTPVRRAAADDELARLKRENELLKLQLQQTRQLLDKANKEIVDLRVARAVDAAKAAKNDESLKNLTIAYGDYRGLIHGVTARQRLEVYRRQAAWEKPTNDSDLVLGVFSPDGKVVAAA